MLDIDTCIYACMYRYFGCFDFKPHKCFNTAIPQSLIKTQIILRIEEFRYSYLKNKKTVYAGDNI